MGLLGDLLNAAVHSGGTPVQAEGVHAGLLNHVLDMVSNPQNGGLKSKVIYK